MKRLIIGLLAIIALAVLFGCTKKSKTETAERADKLNIVATTFPCYDFARAVVKDKADITLLLRPGSEIHSFDPSPSDIIKIQQADLFIYVGGESDVWVEKTLESADLSKVKIVRLMEFITPYEEEVIEGMTEEEEATEEEEEEEYDEHIWTSPANAIALTSALAEIISGLDPKNAESYNSSAAAYIAEIRGIQAEIAEVVKNAKRKKILVADRFPFRYLAEEYNLEYAAAFPGCSAEIDASAATVAFLINTVKNEELPYIYYIELSNQRIADTIKEETGVKTLELHSAQNITGDEFARGETYVTLMKRNVQNLKLGLE
ncbi:MAG: metal ABC transporter substrate-binding protein [Deferribacteraceae bacterium]|jgi:zinc transport system substrate-binding protein|nr:metal ABC transporter substrate-binding protein [Deferribacteraceae bacterium]